MIIFHNRKEFYNLVYCSISYFDRKMNLSSYSYLKKVKRIARTDAILFFFLSNHNFTNVIGKIDWILDWQAFN